MRNKRPTYLVIWRLASACVRCSIRAYTMYRYGLHIVRHVVFDLRRFPRSSSRSSDEVSLRRNGRRQGVPATKRQATDCARDKMAGDEVYCTCGKKACGQVCQRRNGGNETGGTTATKRRRRNGSEEPSSSELGFLHSRFLGVGKVLWF